MSPSHSAAAESPAKAGERHLRAVAQPIDLERLVRRVTELPTLPSTVARILEISGSDNSSAADLAKVIYLDQSLAAKVLRIANSPFYGFARKVKTLEHATVILGFKDIRNMALAMTVFSSFCVKTRNTQFDRVRFWEHSLSCGLAAKVVGEAAGLNRTELFVTGLIHDLGKIILDRYHQDGFQEVLEVAAKTGMRWTEAEQEVLGFTHAELGQALLEAWKFPSELTCPVGFHHRPWEDTKEPKRSAAVYLANRLTIFYGQPNHPGAPKPEPEDIKEDLPRLESLGLKLPVGFLASYPGRLKGETDGIQEYLDCIVTKDMA